jgi:hypothetical protein
MVEYLLKIVFFDIIASNILKKNIFTFPNQIQLFVKDLKYKKMFYFPSI